MAQRVLGLDIGRSSIKGVVLETSVRSFELAACHTEPIPIEANTTEENQKVAVQTALFHLMEHVGEVDQVITALPGNTGAASILDMPFSDPAKIEPTLPLQVDELTPFDIDELIYDYQFIERSKGKGPSKLLIASVPRQRIAEHLEVLQESNVDPRILMMDGTPYAHLFGTVLEKPTVDAWCVVDLGEEQTIISIFRADPEDAQYPIRTETVRSLSRGTRHIREGVAQILGVSLEQVDDWMPQHIQLDPRQPTGNPQITEAFVRTLTPTILELRRNLTAVERKLGYSIGHIYITGGGALLPGIDALMSSRIRLSVERLHVGSIQTKEETEWPASGDTYLKALGMALRSTESRNAYAKLNLRQQEFAFKGDLQFLKDRLGSLMLMAAILFVLFCVSVFTSFYVRGVEGSRLDAEIQKRCFQIVGRRGLSPRRCLGIMNDEIQKVSGKSGRSLIPQVSAYDLLLVFYQRISDLNKDKKIKVEIGSLRITDKRFDFEGKTNSFESVDKIEKQLKSYKCFKQIKKGKVQRATGQGEKIEFRLSAVLSC